MAAHRRRTAMTDNEGLIDYITGKEVADTGAERNRQVVERFLVEDLGYRRQDVGVDVPIAFTVAQEEYHSILDLLVTLNKAPAMVIKCAAGSLGSREREVVAAARLAGDAPLPVAVATDGKTALVYDGRSGKATGEGMPAIPAPGDLQRLLDDDPAEPLTDHQRRRARLVFRSYDSMNVNR
jgi:hypothetical protein